MCPALCNPIDCRTPGFSIPHHLPELAQTYSTELVMPFNHLIPCHPLPFLPSIFPSIRVFSNESVLHIMWPKYWSFSFRISPFSEYYWFDFFDVQGTLKNLLQHHSSKAPILQHSVIFMVQLSHPYMNTGKIIAFTRWTYISRVVSPLFNMLSG